METTTNEEKEFWCKWGEGYYTPEEKMVAMTNFSEENGYDIEDVENISKMKIGDEIDLTQVGAVHTVKRVK